MYLQVGLLWTQTESTVCYSFQQSWEIYVTQRKIPWPNMPETLKCLKRLTMTPVIWQKKSVCLPSYIPNQFQNTLILSVLCTLVRLLINYAVYNTAIFKASNFLQIISLKIPVLWHMMPYGHDVISHMTKSFMSTAVITLNIVCNFHCSYNATHE